ncbi:MAG: amidase [Limnohabitans sp.]
MAIHELSATALSQAIHAKQYACREVMQAFLDRIDKLNPRFNAVVSLQKHELLLAQADACDQELARGHSRGWLHGIPLAFKDLVDVAGIPTTCGSVLLRDKIPTHDALLVQRLKAQGGIVIGKTNTPEWGLGSNTFNSVFGATGNSFNPAHTAGGSSGGAAVALAQRLLPLADGSDFMGSLRNPAAWNNVFGMRPSQGRVPAFPAHDVWVNQLSTDGPMARHVGDLARMLETMSGFDPRSPLSLDDLPKGWSQQLRPQSSGIRVGWLGDLNGYLPMEDGILQACENGLQRLSDLGAQVDPAKATFSPPAVWQTWLAWRRVLTASRLAPMVERGRESCKPEALWECDQAIGMTANDFLKASTERTVFYHQLLKMFEAFDVLVMPSAQVWPFDIDTRWPADIRTAKGTVHMDTYHRWMEVVLYPSLAGLPSLNVPCGFDARGLPMGMQLIGQPRGDPAVLELGLAYEEAASYWLARHPGQ